MAPDSDQPCASDASPTGEPPHLDLDRFVPFLVIALANQVGVSASRLLLERFGCGITEWRIVSMLAGQDGIAPGAITSVTGIDKSSVSRALKALEARDQVKVLADPGHKRRQLLSLTPAGRALHDRIIGLVAARESLLLTGFSETELEELTGYLKRMLDNVPLVKAFSREQARGDT